MAECIDRGAALLASHQCQLADDRVHADLTDQMHLAIPGASANTQFAGTHQVYPVVGIVLFDQDITCIQFDRLEVIGFRALQALDEIGDLMT